MVVFMSQPEVGGGCCLVVPSHTLGQLYGTDKSRQLKPTPFLFLQMEKSWAGFDWELWKSNLFLSEESLRETLEKETLDAPLLQEVTFLKKKVLSKKGWYDQELRRSILKSQFVVLDIPKSAFYKGCENPMWVSPRQGLVSWIHLV